MLGQRCNELLDRSGSAFALRTDTYKLFGYRNKKRRTFDIEALSYRRIMDNSVPFCLMESRLSHEEGQLLNLMMLTKNAEGFRELLANLPGKEINGSSFSIDISLTQSKAQPNSACKRNLKLR